MATACRAPDETGFASLDRTIRRVVILGNAGSGKSTLARRIGAILALPVIHMDLLFWEANWTEPDPGTFRQRVAAAVSGDRWICEGNYARKTFDLRLPRADAVIWLDTPGSVCALRVLRRSLFAAQRDDLPADCVERLNLEFLGFLNDIWTFERRRRPAIEAEQSMHGSHVPTVRLRGKKQIAAYLRGLAEATG